MILSPQTAVHRSICYHLLLLLHLILLSTVTVSAANLNLENYPHLLCLWSENLPPPPFPIALGRRSSLCINFQCSEFLLEFAKFWKECLAIREVKIHSLFACKVPLGTYMDRRVPDIKEITENEKDGHPYLGVRHLLMMGREGKGPGEGKCAK